MATRPNRRSDRPTASQARAARRQRRQRRKRTVRLGVFAVIFVIALLFIVSLFAGSLPISIGNRGGGGDSQGERLQNQGQDHIQLGAEHPAYNSLPAASGWHYNIPLAPAPWGIHDNPLPDEVLIHNLEHGGVRVHYNCPEGCDELVTQLATVVDSYLVNGGEVVMTPYPGMETTIALVGWTFIDRFDVFDETRVRAFIEDRMNSPVAPEYQAR